MAAATRSFDGTVAQPSDSSRRTAAIVSIALVIAVFVVYGQLGRHPFTNYDDPEYIVNNPHVTTGLTFANIAWAFTHVYASNWHPLTWISHMVDVQFFGLNAGRHLLVNVLLHALNSLLLFLALRKATSRLWPSAAVAALFALHPLHVESVAWAAERKDVLSTFFFMLLLLAYVGYAQKRSAGRYIAVVLALILGLMAKPMLVTVPFVLLLLDFWPLQRMVDATAVRRLIVEKIPLFAIVAASSAMTMHAQQRAMTPLALPYRLANAALSYLGYLWKTVWPSGLAVLYPYRTTMAPTRVMAAAVVLLAITIVAAVYARRLPWLAVGWFWYVGMLVPVIGVVQVGQQAMADRYTYVPLIGIFIAVVWLLASWKQPTLLAIAATIVLLSLSAATYLQAGYWRDSVTLFRHAAAVTRPSAAVQTSLGLALLSDRDYAGAQKAFESAVAMNPRDAAARRGLGTTLIRTGDPSRAEKELRAAIALDPQEPTAHADLGNLLVTSGRKQEAIQHFQKSVAGRDDPQTRAALAAAQGNEEAALAAYAEAIGNGVDTGEIHNDYAAALARKGRDAEAFAQYGAALRIDPQQYDAHMNIGALLSRMDRNEEAAAHFAAAAKLRPTSSEPNVYLALIHAQTGRFRDAVADVDAAVKADPVTANQQLTNAIRIPFKESNIADYRAFLEGKAEGRQP